ncbi:uncharacterized protein LOC123306112 [Chrysoperla carnea]|uniref:uncharacterized protein LOC123306112 n=1 Tax=Chrysoperla carnea TaxID=189513 RepID=UPI001D069513|nr:uncharacterized protein LOC123306112 [Chrysoperla carnea]
MVLHCCVKGCVKTQKDISLHVIPKNFEKFKDWTIAIDRTDIEYSKRENYHVCDLHFADEMKLQASTGKLRTNLKPNAFPSLHLSRSPIASTSRKIMAINIEEEQIRPAFQIDLKKKMYLLKEGNVRRVKELSKTARKYYHIAKDMLKLARKLKDKNETYLKRLENNVFILYKGVGSECK